MNPDVLLCGNNDHTHNPPLHLHIPALLSFEFSSMANSFSVFPCFPPFIPLFSLVIFYFPILYPLSFSLIRFFLCISVQSLLCLLCCFRPYIFLGIESKCVCVWHESSVVFCIFSFSEAASTQAMFQNLVSSLPRQHVKASSMH